MKFTAAELEKSKYRFPSVSHKYTPSPRTAEGNVLRNDRRNRAERVGIVVLLLTPRIIWRTADPCQSFASSRLTAINVGAFQVCYALDDVG